VDAVPNIIAAQKAPRASRLDQVDSLRAFAMAAVIAQHSGIFPCGWIGVWLFYVISGFVVTKTLLDTDVAKPKSERLSHFYIRRSARIWPIYFLMIVAGLLISAHSVGHFEWRPFLSLALFYNNFEMAFGNGNFANFNVGHLWTISVEWQFYLLYGVSFFLLPKRVLISILVAFLFLCPVLRYLASVLISPSRSPLDTAFAIYSFSALHFDSFGAGALLAFSTGAYLNKRRAFILFFLGLATLVIYVATFVLINYALGAQGVSLAKNIVSGILFGQLREVFVYTAIWLASVGLLALGVTQERLFFGILAWRPFPATGRISYGGYVYHMCALGLTHAFIGPVFGHPTDVEAKLLAGFATFLIALSLTIGMAWLSYRYFERPILRFTALRLSTARLPGARTDGIIPSPDKQAL
jgi:peptidoglycan/LPS O-acetylase OafA/YrhL